ncbi:MAG: sulfite exporter TauE/SafE family protein [Spirochaetales bacterium]
MTLVLTFSALFVASWLAATISGAAGFGGALLLLPVLTNLLGVKTAVPVLTLAQLWGNASRAWFGRRVIQWKAVLYFVSTAIPFSIFGSFLLVDLPKGWILTSIGLLLMVIVLLRRLRVTKIRLGEKGLLFGGALTGFLSGLAGSAGPLGAAFFFGLDLPALSYVASEAVTALSMHIIKTVVYQRFALIGFKEFFIGMFLGVGMILGSWTGKKIIEKLPKEKFILLVEVLLLISSVQLIFF